MPATSEPVELVPADGGQQLAPLERMALPHALSGARGTNRVSALSYLRAAHDLDALRAYLARYDDQASTLRAYTRELERLLLWAVIICDCKRGDLRGGDSLVEHPSCPCVTVSLTLK
ncbi:hypothetical protein [Burkholderia alba]|uniref:hypothetical protein n=1 Tax=Burkholderia alba TaxID=2683677 RepID=UPI0038990EA9